MHLAALLLATALCLPFVVLYGRYFDRAMLVLGKLRRGEPLGEGEGALVGNAEAPAKG